MPPYTNIPLSPAELSYLHSSLAQDPPIRPDGRTPTQFRPLVAETDILPSANGSARVCFADGTEAIVGVKAEVESTALASGGSADPRSGAETDNDISASETIRLGHNGKGDAAWVEVSVEIPSMRDDDPLPVFLGSMLTEALLADGGALTTRLYMNRRFHWRLHIDILLLSQPLSYPLPLLSLTTHLALLSTRLPALVSENDEDPLFNDDWEASISLYPIQGVNKPSVTLLVMSVGDNIIFDPSRDELAVADAVTAISISENGGSSNTKGKDLLKLLAIRSIDPPSRLTAAGVPIAPVPVAGQGSGAAALTTLSATEAALLREQDQGQTVWRPPRGGIRREVLARMIKTVLEKGGVGQEVMEGLEGVRVGSSV